MWPADPVARAWARSISAEMHSGFARAAQRDDDVHPRARRRAAVVDGARRRHRARRPRSGTKSRRRFGAGGALPVRRVLDRRRVLRAGRVSLPDLRRDARRRRRRLSRGAARASVHARMGSARRSRRRRSSTPTSRASSIATSLPRRPAGVVTAAHDDPALAALRERDPRGGRGGRAAAHSRRRHQGFLRRARSTATSLDTAALRRHRRLRSDRARHHRARRHAARRHRSGAARRAARCSRSSRRISARARRSAASSPRVSRVRGGPTRARCATSCSACASSTARGDELAFGGRVMKNVAGFDVSRLMTGALGTLGVMTEVSLKCLPLPQGRGDARASSARPTRRSGASTNGAASRCRCRRPAITTGRLCGAPVRRARRRSTRPREDRRRRMRRRATRSGAACATRRTRSFVAATRARRAAVAAVGQVDRAVRRSAAASS